MSSPRDPALRDPALRDPALRDPALRDPALRDPAPRDPALRDPALRDPALRDPAAADTPRGQPAVDDGDETLYQAIEAGHFDGPLASDPELVKAVAAHHKLEALFELLREPADLPSHTQDDHPITERPMPDRIGRYAIRRVLGQGTFGTVYLADDPELNRPVAIKVPRAGRFATAADADKFLDEARHAAGLKHPAIVAVYDVGRDGLDCHIVMEYVAGRTLEEVLATERLSHMAVARLLALVADALHYAHQKGFVHRDLKPGNIMLEAGGVVRGGGVSGRVVSGRVVSGRVVSGRVVGVVSGTEADGFTSHPSPLTTHPSPKLLDFGLAVSEESQRQLAGKVAGTPAYMAPEQVRGETHRLDGRADIWSLGVIAYQLLTGRQPFWRGDVKACLDEIEQREPKPPRQIDDSIPAELERITLRCLAKRVTDRYTTGRDLAADFRRWLRSQGKRRNVPPPIVEHGTTTAASSDTTPQRSPAANQRLSIAMRWVACAPAARSSIANDGRCRRTSPAANRGSPSQAPRPATAPRPMPSATLPNRFPSQFDRGMCVTC